MEIPSWAFASAGKSLYKPVQTTISRPVVKVQPPPVPVPVIDTFYDEIIDAINDMIPKQSLLIDLLIELYI